MCAPFILRVVFKEYKPGRKDSPKLIIESGDKTYFMTFWDKYTMDITREEIEQYLGEVFMIEYIEGPMEWFWAQNQAYSITLKDGRQVLKVDREEYINLIWGVRSLNYIEILAIPPIMLVSLI